MRPNRLVEIRQSISDPLPARSVGIFNVQKRIKLYFGEEFGLDIENLPGSGARVTVEIPKIRGIR